jgi:hypothetical protein
MGIEEIRSSLKVRMIFAIVRTGSPSIGFRIGFKEGSMDPLSDVLSLLKPRTYSSGGFDMGGELSIQFQRHEGIKCYAVIFGQCWLVCGGRSGAGAPHCGRLLPAAQWTAFPPCYQPEPCAD